MLEKANEAKMLIEAEELNDLAVLDSYHHFLYNNFWLISSLSTALISTCLSQEKDVKVLLINLLKSLGLRIVSFGLYSNPEYDAIKLINSISDNLGFNIPKIDLEKYIEFIFDENKKDVYIAKLFHVVSTTTFSYLINFIYEPNFMSEENYYKLLLDSVISSVMALQAQYYFNAEEQLVEAINKNYYHRVDAIINYRIPKEKKKILEVIDILSKNIKCREIEEMYCKSAIESALKLVDRSIDAESTNKSIKLAVSLALSLGKTSKISDEVLNKIEEAEAFSEIIDVVKGYLNEDKYSLKIKDDASNFLLRVSDKVPKELIPNLIKILLSIGRANKISEDVLNKIEGPEAFSEIIDIVKGYLVNDDKYSLKIKDDAINFLARISDKVSGLHLLSNKIIEIASDVLRINDTKKIHDHNVEIPPPTCKVNEESCKELSTIEDFKESNQIMEKEYNALEQSQLIKIIDSAIDLIYKTSETSRWSYMPSDENGVTVLNNIAQYLLKLDKLGHQYPDQDKKLENTINNILSKCIGNNCLFKGVEILLPIGRANKISDEVLKKIPDDESFSRIIDKISYAINIHESKKVTDSAIDLAYNLSKINGWSYMPSDENGVTVLNNIAQYLLKLDKLGHQYPDQDKKLENTINNILSKCIGNNCLFKGVEILLPIGRANKISDEVLKKIPDDESFSRIIDKISYAINIHESKKVTDSAIDLAYNLSKINGWSYKPSDENGVTVLNNIAQYLLKLRELGLEYTEQVIKLHDSINNILYKCNTTDCKIKIVEKLLYSDRLDIISDSSISNLGKGIGAVDIFSILENFNYKSSWYVINKFASSLLSSCGVKCIGHAMELFYKSGDFKNQIESFKKDFPITKIVDKLLDDIDPKLLADIDDQLLINNIESSTEKNSLEAALFKYLVSSVKEATKEIQISIETDCIKKVEDKFHKAFYGDIYPTSNFSEGLLQDIEHCYGADNSTSITQNEPI